MDTRKKIVGIDEAEALLAGVAFTLVTGYFDPLRAAHAERLEALARPDRKLVVMIKEPDQPLLSTSSRAELVAGLGVVDYVLLPRERASAALIERLAPADLMREEGADEKRFQDLVLLAHQRNGR